MLLPKLQIRSKIFVVARRRPPFPPSSLLASRLQWCLGRPHSRLLGRLWQKQAPNAATALLLPYVCKATLESKQWQ